MPLHKTGHVFVQDHDPSDQTDYTFRFRLSTGESITGATVAVVDPDTDLPPVPTTDLALADVSFGLMDDEVTWGVTVWVAGGTASHTYYLRCQVTTDSSPLPRIFNRTVRLLCAEQ
jgi:hypothetical protein